MEDMEDRVKQGVDSQDSDPLLPLSPVTVVAPSDLSPENWQLYKLAATRAQSGEMLTYQDIESCGIKIKAERHRYYAVAKRIQRDLGVVFHNVQGCGYSPLRPDELPLRIEWRWQKAERQTQRALEESGHVTRRHQVSAWVHEAIARMSVLSQAAASAASLIKSTQLPRPAELADQSVYDKLKQGLDS